MSQFASPREASKPAGFAGVCLLIVSLSLAGASKAGAGAVEVLTRAAPDLVSDTAGGGSGFTPGVRRLSADGRYVVFVSTAPNLPPGQAAPGIPKNQVFLHDRISGATTLVSHAAGSLTTPANGYSEGGVLSADGRYVAFSSEATNLVPGQTDANGFLDVFLYDRVSGTTVLVSHAAGSPDTTGDLYSQGFLTISADGRFVAFQSLATNLVAGQTDGNGISAEDVFLFDRTTGNVELVSRSAASPMTTANGSSVEPVLSADGGFVAFASRATNLVAGQVDGNGIEDVFLFDRATGTTVLVSHTSSSPTTTSNGISFRSTLSGDGRYVTFVGSGNNLVASGTDTNSALDVFLFDRVAGTVTLVSHTNSSPIVAASGESTFSTISADGAYVAFESGATDLVSGQVTVSFTHNVFLFDRASGVVTLVSRSALAANHGADGHSFEPLISASGDYVAFASGATDMTATPDGNLTDDAFLYHRTTGTVTLVSRSGQSPGQTANSRSASLEVSGDGRIVAFFSAASDLLANWTDTNGSDDVFLFDRSSGDVATVALRDPAFPSLTAGGPSDTAGTPVNDSSVLQSTRAAMSGNGRWVASSSFATNLAPGQEDTNLTLDVFLHDVATGAAVLVSRSSSSPRRAGNGTSDRATVSEDGRFVAFMSLATDLAAGQDENGDFDVFLYDRQTGTNTLVSRSASSPNTAGDAGSFYPCLSRNGRFVVFVSRASDLVPGQVDNNNFDLDVFLYDRQTGTTTLVSHVAGSSVVTSDQRSGEGFAISTDGRFVAFASMAENLIPGQVDFNFELDVFLYDRVLGTTALVSRSPSSPTTAVGGFQPSLDDDGRFLAFTSGGTDFVPGLVDANGTGDVFVFDRKTGAFTLVSRSAASPLTTGNDGSEGPVIDGQGKHVAFTSLATDLVPGQSDGNGDLDVFLFDRSSRKTLLVSRSAASPATTGNTGSLSPVLNRNGRHIAFLSRADDLVPGQSDTNFDFDVFLFDAANGTTTLASRSAASTSTAGNLESFGPSLSDNGRRLVFTSNATNLVPGDFNTFQDVFLFRSGPGGDED